MTAGFRRARVLALYVLVPLLSAAAPLLVIPAATSTYGADGWSSIAIGLAIGLTGAVIGELGWAIVGPQQVARRPDVAAQTYDRALAARLVVVLPLAGVCAGIAAALAHDHRAAAALLATGVTLGALSPSWFFTGQNRPHLTLLCESVPRAVLVAAAALAIANGGALELYGVALSVAAVFPLLTTAWFAGVPCVPSVDACRAVPATLREQWVVVIGRGVTTLYKALPTPILALVAPDLVALYAALDRPLRLGLQFLTALPQRLQAWVAVEDDALRARRSSLSTAANAVLGVAAGGLYALGMPLLAPTLFSGVVVIDHGTSALGGLLVAAICASRGFGLALVASGRAGATTASAVVSAGLGVPGVVIGAVLLGVPGVLIALLVAETAGIVAQWRLLLLERRMCSRTEMSV